MANGDKSKEQQGIAGTKEVLNNINRIYPPETPIEQIVRDTTPPKDKEAEEKA